MKQMERITIIYIPGLFDRIGWLQFLQRQMIAAWRTLGVNSQMFVMGWSADADFTQRLTALEEVVDSALAKESKVALVGSSAGASAVLALLAQSPEKVSAAVTICGKIHRPQAIPEAVLEFNSVFDQALDQLPQRLEQLTSSELDRTLALHAFKDGIVPPQDAVINGAHNRRIPAIGHIPGIATALISLAPLITGFCKRHAAQNLTLPKPR